MGLDLSFTGFLIEMETTSLEKERIKEIIHRLISKDKSWLGDHFILSGDKGNYWILNYLQGPRNEYNSLVRGMIVKKPDQNWSGDELDLIRSFPFTRFFNHGEKDAAHVDFSNAEMLEKLDGTMVGVFFPHGNTTPEFHTRKMSSINSDDMAKKITSFHGKEFKFLPIIKEYVDKLSFDETDVKYTYVFEFLHEVSFVLTKYKESQYGLYLLGARNIKTHRELTEDQLALVAKRIGARRPRRYDTIANISDIEKMFKLAAEETPDFEGYVFRDKTTGNRVKVKDPEYVRKHHVLDSTSYKALIPRILVGEEDEVIAYFPHMKTRIDEIKQHYNDFIDKIYNKIMTWKAKDLSPKDLPTALFGERKLPKWEIRLKQLHGEITKITPAEPDKFVRSMILSCYTLDKSQIKAKIDEALKRIALGQGNNLGDPKELIQMIGLNDDSEEKEEKPDEN